MSSTAQAQQATLTDSSVKTLTQKKREDTIAGLLFMAPAFLVFLVFLFIPIFFALFISFTDWNGISPLGQRATGSTGTVVFTNQTDETITIPAGTRLESMGAEPITFQLTDDVTVPAGVDNTAEASIEAVDGSLGSETNIRANAVTQLPSELQERVSVTNPTPTRGGVNDAFDMVGTRNYQDLLINPGLAQRDFFNALKNTVYFVLGVVPAQTFLALILAVIVNQRWLKAKGFFRTAYYFPSVTSSVVISLVFMWMFTRGGLVNTAIGAIFPNYEFITWLDDPSGVIHNLLATFGVTRTNVGDWASTRVVGLTIWDWISGPSVTLSMIMILNTWTTIGTMMVIYLAALQNIPSQVYEAAAIDGATNFQIFRKITAPLLAPTTFFVVTLGLIGTFQVFDQVFVISSGGPAKTTMTIAYIVYENGFNNSRMGLAASTALVLFVIIFLFTLVQRRFTSERAAV